MVMQCSRQVVSSRHPDVRVSFVPLGCGQGHQHHHQPSGRGTELLPRRSLYRRRSPPDTAAVPQIDPSLPADARQAQPARLGRPVPADLGPELRRGCGAQLQEQDEGLPGENGKVRQALILSKQHWFALCGFGCMTRD